MNTQTDPNPTPISDPNRNTRAVGVASIGLFLLILGSLSFGKQDWSDGIVFLCLALSCGITYGSACLWDESGKKTRSLAATLLKLLAIFLFFAEPSHPHYSSKGPVAPSNATESAPPIQGK